MTEPKPITDIKSVFSDHTRTQKAHLAMALEALASEFESQGLHYQSHIPTAERYMEHARLFERLAEAIR